MTIHIHHPSPPLNNFIDCFIHMEGLSFTHTLDRFLPDGNTELIIDLGEKPQFIHDNDTLKVIQRCTHAWVSGVRTRPITIPSGTGNHLMVVAFKKGAASPFYSFPMNEITDSVVMADLIFGRSICELRERLSGTSSVAEMFRLVESFLITQAGDKLHVNAPSRCIQHAIAHITGYPHIFRFQAFSEHIGYSQKHFIDLFRKQVGVTPKQYLKIIRFQKAVLQAGTAQTINWSRLAQESGFYDQAHFIHDFKEFSGFTPHEYQQRKNAELNYVPVQ
jgi:AraC-like DNA-binding protein